MPTTNLSLRTGENTILAALSPDELHTLLPNMELVRMKLRDTLYKPGERITHVYFPLTAMYCMITVMSDGSRVEAATIGNEGMSGVPLSLPNTVSPILMICQIEGESVRVDARVFRTWLAASATARDLMDRHAQALLGLVAQTAACNRLHSVEQRAARWLLMTADRAHDSHFDMTQDFLAAMLGVRRASVNISNLSLQRAGIVKYQRGRMEVLDPARARGACLRVLRNPAAASDGTDEAASVRELTPSPVARAGVVVFELVVPLGLQAILAHAAYGYLAPVVCARSTDLLCTSGNRG